MIIRGGENIYPCEVEDFLHQLPEILDVEVIGVPSQRYGEEVMAWVRLHEGASVTGDELVSACRGRIATYKIPRYWKFVDSFPVTVTGKTQKYRMREIAAAELGLCPPDSEAAVPAPCALRSPSDPGHRAFGARRQTGPTAGRSAAWPRCRGARCRRARFSWSKSTATPLRRSGSSTERQWPIRRAPPSR
jgi:hypothetical protein